MSEDSGCAPVDAGGAVAAAPVLALDGGAVCAGGGAVSAIFASCVAMVFFFSGR